MMKPIFVRELKKRGELVKKFEPEQLSSTPICSKQTLLKAKELLESVVKNGTGKTLNSAIFQIAGKTGTAQIAKVGKGYGNEGEHTYQASFVGYFPADKPKYSCMVMVSAPSNGEYYGALVAGPIFKDVAYKVYSTTLEIHKQINTPVQNLSGVVPSMKGGAQKEVKFVLDQLYIKCNSANTDYKWLKPVLKDSVQQFTENKIQENLESGVMPDLRGMNLKDALYLLENAGINVKVSGNGSVKEQSIEPGSKFKRGASINLVLS